MGGAWLLFSLPGCVFSLLGCVVVVTGRGDEQRYSTITSQLYNELRPKIRDTDVLHPHHPHLPPHSATLAPPYLLLPVFRHQPTPLVSKELFSPVAGSRALPSILSNILIPQGGQPSIRVPSVNNNHGVEVWCGYSKLAVRIHLDLLRFRSSAAHFRLGTCPASRAEGSVLYFEYDLKECGSLISVIKGQLLYANEVIYRPESQGVFIRAVPLTLPIQCVYDRFHYSYKIGYLPEVRAQSFRKTMVKQQVFSLSLRNEKWEELGANNSYVLGEPMYFEVGAEFISKDENVYVQACHVTVGEDSNSTQLYDVISNFGCMVDSKRAGSHSHFVSRQMNILRFSLDAFLFAEVASQRFYLHCTVGVGNATASATAKSCTYTESERRWEELHGDASICNCCDSVCGPPGSAERTPCEEEALVIGGPWRLTHSGAFSETSDERLDTMSGSVHLHHHPQEEEEELQEEEFCVGEELEEEVLIGVAETENDEGMEGGDTVNMVKAGDEEKEEHDDADEVEKPN